jgi:hypothetical protein
LCFIHCPAPHTHTHEFCEIVEYNVTFCFVHAVPVYTHHKSNDVCYCLYSPALCFCLLCSSVSSSLHSMLRLDCVTPRTFQQPVSLCCNWFAAFGIETREDWQYCAAQVEIFNMCVCMYKSTYTLDPSNIREEYKL